MDNGYTLKVIVNVGKIINVELLKVKPKKVSIEVREVKAKILTISPSNVSNKSVRYRTNNKKIVTIDENGQIKRI